jgi:hypothetical protein
VSKLKVALANVAAVVGAAALNMTPCLIKDSLSGSFLLQKLGIEKRVDHGGQGSGSSPSIFLRVSIFLFKPEKNSTTAFIWGINHKVTFR